jgi:hypothetical protein
VTFIGVICNIQVRPTPTLFESDDAVVVPPGDGWMAGGEELAGDESLNAGDNRGI